MYRRSAGVRVQAMRGPVIEPALHAAGACLSAEAIDRPTDGRTDGRVGALASYRRDDVRSACTFKKEAPVSCRPIIEVIIAVTRSNHDTKARLIRNRHPVRRAAFPTRARCVR